MKRGWITLLVAVAALAAYGLGFERSAWGLVGVGAGLELWFWVRVWPREPSQPAQPT